MQFFKILPISLVLLLSIQWQSQLKSADLLDDIYSGAVEVKNLDPELLTAIRAGDIENINFLLNDAKTNPDVTDDSGNTALDLAIASENLAAIGLLLAAGANVKTVNKYHDIIFNPVLINAVKTGNPEVVQLLLAAGADLNLIDEAGDTALKIAQREGYDEIVSLLETAALSKDQENLAPSGVDRFKARAVYGEHVKNKYGTVLNIN